MAAAVFTARYCALDCLLFAAVVVRPAKKAIVPLSGAGAHRAARSAAPTPRKIDYVINRGWAGERYGPNVPFPGKRVCLVALVGFFTPAVLLH